ncbi:MAG: VWA domain-containing protein [Acidobacteriota bacterium]
MSAELRTKRWRLLLGQEAEGSTQVEAGLSADERRMDRALELLYGGEEDEHGNRQAGLERSNINVPRWLGDIRKYFPSSVVQVMQTDALERLDLHRLLLEPEMLEAVEADVHLVATLVSMRGLLPVEASETARQVVAKVVEELQRKLEQPMRTAVSGAINRASRTLRPRRHSDIDWNRTIRANLRHYQPEHRTIVPETLIGFGRQQRSLRDITLCIDQSGSMAESVVYSSVFGAVLASLPSVSTRLVVFDTSVVDLTEELDDPVEVLFSTQLGGGTDINRAVGYCQEKIENPEDSIFVLISDLYEGGVEEELLKRTAQLIASGVQVIVLLALSDEGAPAYDAKLARKLAVLGAPSFACTPELFPDLMAAAIAKKDLGQWLGEKGITGAR